MTHRNCCLASLFGLTCAAGLLLSAFLSPAASLRSASPEDKKGEEKGKIKGSILNALPKDSLLLFRVPSVKGLVDKFKKSPFYALKDHPRVKELASRLESVAKKQLPASSEGLDSDLKDLLPSISGECVIAVGNLDKLASKISRAVSMPESPSIQPEDISLILSIDAGDASKKMREVLEKVVSLAEKDGWKRQVEEAQGSRITILEKGAQGGEKKAAEAPLEGKDAPKEDSTPSDEKPEKKGKAKSKEKKPQRLQLSFAEVGSQFLLGSSPDLLKQSLARLSSPPEDSLASNALFQETQKESGAGADASLYLNIVQLTSFIDATVSTSMFGFFWEKVKDVLFGKSLKSLGMSLSLEERGLKANAFVHNGGAADGMLGLFKGDAFSVAPPTFVPADAESYVAFGFSPKRLEEIVRDLAQLVMSFSGAGADVDSFFEENVGMKPKDLTSALGGRVHFFNRKKAPTEPQRLAFFLELKDEAPFKKVFEKFSSPPNDALKAEKYKDKDIYSVSAGSANLWYALSRKVLAVTMAKEDLDLILVEGDSRPGLSLNEEFKRVTRDVPTRVVALCYGSQGAEGSLKGFTEAAGGLDQETRSLVEAMAAFGDVLDAEVGYALWKESGLYAEDVLFYRKK